VPRFVKVRGWFRESGLVPEKEKNMNLVKLPKIVKCWQFRMKTDYCAKCARQIKVSKGFEPESIFWSIESDKVWPESFHEPLYCTKSCAEQALKDRRQKC
jgi:hypothetical protein